MRGCRIKNITIHSFLRRLAQQSKLKYLVLLVCFKFPLGNKMFTTKSLDCYNKNNITATPIEEAQPWRFFIAPNKWRQHV